MCERERIEVLNIKEGAVVEIYDGVTALLVRLPGDDLPVLVLTAKGLKRLAYLREEQARSRLRARGLLPDEDES